MEWTMYRVSVIRLQDCSRQSDNYAFNEYQSPHILHLLSGDGGLITLGLALKSSSLRKTAALSNSTTEVSTTEVGRIFESNAWRSGKRVARHHRVKKADWTPYIIGCFPYIPRPKHHSHAHLFASSELHSRSIITRMIPKVCMSPSSNPKTDRHPGYHVN
jgi:hypothetical protein